MLHSPLEKLSKPQLRLLWILTRKSRVQSLVSIIHTVSPNICRGPMYTHSPAIILEERGGARIAQVYPRSEVPALGGKFLLRQPFSRKTLLLMSTLAVLLDISLGISKAYTTLLPLFILEGRGKGLKHFLHLYIKVNVILSSSLHLSLSISLSLSVNCGLFIIFILVFS